MATASIESFEQGRAARGEASIRLQAVEKVYRTDRLETVALANVNLEVAQGELLASWAPPAPERARFCISSACSTRPLAGNRRARRP